MRKCLFPHELKQGENLKSRSRLDFGFARLRPNDRNQFTTSTRLKSSVSLILEILSRSRRLALESQKGREEGGEPTC